MPEKLELLPMHVWGDSLEAVESRDGNRTGSYAPKCALKGPVAYTRADAIGMESGRPASGPRADRLQPDAECRAKASGRGAKFERSIMHSSGYSISGRRRAWRG